MATSIAKLAILLTTDTNGMRAGFGQGERLVTSFNRRVSGASGFGASTSGLAAFTKNLNSANGSMNSLLGLAARNGPIIALGAAFVLLGKRAMESAEKSTQAAVATTDAYEKAWQTVSGQSIDVGNNKIDTLTGQWERLKETIGATSNATAGPLNRAFAEILKVANMAASDMNKSLGLRSGPDPRLKQMEDFTKRQTEANAAQEKADKEASERATRAHERLKASANSLTQSLRTPIEVFRDTLREIQDLSSQGLIDPNTAGRGISKANKDLQDALKTAEKLRAVMKVPGVAAAERNTAAGASAVASGKAELARLAEQAKQQLAEQRRMNDQLSKINDELKKPKPPIQIGKVNI